MQSDRNNTLGDSSDNNTQNASSPNAYAILDVQALASSIDYSDEDMNSDSESDNDKYEKESDEFHHTTSGKGAYYEYNKPTVTVSVSAPTVAQNAYGGFGADIMAAMENPSKPLNAPVKAKESKSASGKTQLMGKKAMRMFGDNVHRAKITENKKGEGSNGVVYELELFSHNSDNASKRCAIKTPKKSAHSANDNLKKFFTAIKEIDKANQSRGLLIPYGTFLGKPSNQLYLCMPLADYDGDTLIELIPHLSLNDKNNLIRHIVITLTKTFLDMNALKIRHLDPKPSNIMFTKQGDILLGDFDSASVFDEHGKFLHRPERFDTDSRFNPKDQLKKADADSVLNTKFKALDAYRLGLTFLLICIARTDLVDTKLNAMKARPFPTINQLLDSALDSQETIANLLIAAEIPNDVASIIIGLLATTPEERLTIEKAWEMAELLQPALNEVDVQGLFAELDNVRMERVHSSKAEIEKEKESEKEQGASKNDDLIVTTTDLDKIFKAASENNDHIEHDDMNEILDIIAHEQPSDVTGKLLAVLDKYKKAGKTSANIIGESSKSIGQEGSSHQAFNTAMAGFMSSRLWGNAKRAMGGTPVTSEKNSDNAKKTTPLAESNCTIRCMIRSKNPGEN